MRVAIIDCGTNTIRLLIAEPGAAGLVTLYRDLKYVRLGQGVDATGYFHPEALARVFQAAADYAQVIASYGVDQLRFIATSASRDVTNRDEFYRGIEARLHVTPDVISGAEEARLSFLGALAGGPVPAGRILVVDIGGGSTELILGDATGRIEQATSLQLGSVRLRERYLHDDPPSADQIAAARAFVAQQLDGSGVPLAAADTWLVDGPQLGELRPAADAPPEAIALWIGVAGTNTSLSALHQGLTVYDPDQVHNSYVAAADIMALSERLFQLSVAETLRAFPLLAPLRAEVICGGVLIAAEIARRVGRSMLVRETDILDGGALDAIQRAQGE